MSFGNPALTTETRYIPYQFYRFIQLYEQFGGDPKKLDTLLAENGINKGELEHNYNRLYGNGGGDYISADAEATDASTLGGYAEELAKYCEIANELSGLSPAEYAARSEEEHLIDSVLWQAMQYYIGVGGTEESLQAYDNYRKLDQARSRRLNEEYVGNHPEFNR